MLAFKICKWHGAGSFLRHVLRSAAHVAYFIVVPAIVHASPAIPLSDDVVLERLPEAGNTQASTLRAKQKALAADPTNQNLALDVARADLGISRALGDPRYLGRAQAALAPWLRSENPPAPVLLLQAIILQSNHDFPAALRLLDTVTRDQPGNGQAWLVKAAIHQAQADYAAATADCGQFAGFIIGLAPDICTASIMSLTGHAPLALRAVRISLASNAVEAGREPEVAMWAMTLAAETASRLQDPEAEHWFSRALTLNSKDPYLLGAWSDWLLDHGRGAEIVPLLTSDTRIDPLLLRLALAEHALHLPTESGHIADLAARFRSSALRGDTVHRREEARFVLELLNQPGRALDLAAANWSVQREPADARVLLEAVLAARLAAPAQPVIDWLAENHIQDARLTALAERVKALAPPPS